MSSIVDNQSDKRQEARDALLDAITIEVGKIDQSDHQVNRVTMLKRLSEAYALVYHGSKIDQPPKS
ncbi:hypothetical protein [Streptomyces turgidiscabies]|uniref:hypothetical protein n=1 Tax=Streptomyces turgidiscabies TaxID=85558 RepID=UPI0038F813CB